MGLEEILLFVFIVLSAFFSASETALTSLAPTSIEHLIEKSNKALSLWLEHPIKVLITILIGNNLVNIFAATFATVLAKRYFEKIGIAIVAGIMTFIIITFGEIFPKSVARKYNEKISCFFMPVIRIFYIFFYPFTFLFFNFTKLFHGRPEIAFKERDLIYAIQISSKKGFLSGIKPDILLSILKLRDLSVREIMVPRSRVSCASLDMSKEELLKIFFETGYSRIPVYEGNENNVIGILHAKEMLKDFKNLKEILRKAIFVYENQKVFFVLERMKAERIHMACVVDENGVLVGIVTMEDILEEIFGEIEDEYDKKEEIFKKLKDGEYFVRADLPIWEIKKHIPISFPEKRDYNTIAGFLSFNLGKIPKKGEKFVWDGYEFEIVESEKKRPLKIKIKKI